MQQSTVDEFSDGTARLERGIEREPWIWPLPSLATLLFDGLSNAAVLDVHEAFTERTVAVDHFVSNAERVH
ncbi:hypothetical protein ACTXMO_04105 [Glutamicibacter arilaitensis]